MALALIEAGARAVYCVDLPKEPSEEWHKVREYAASMQGKGGEGRLEYVSGNVTDQVRLLLGHGQVWANDVRDRAQAAMWKIGEDIGDKEGRMDACVAAAGVLKSHTDCLEYPASQFRQVRAIMPCAKNYRGKYH